MSLIGTSLNAATTTGAGSEIQFDKPKSDISMQLTITGSPSTVQVDLQGSLDGSTYISINSEYVSSPPSPYSIFVFSTGKPVASVRANVISLSGGTSPTVTAVLGAAG